jgi:hypothetical protein
LPVHIRAIIHEQFLRSFKNVDKKLLSKTFQRLGIGRNGAAVSQTAEAPYVIPILSLPVVAGGWSESMAWWPKFNLANWAKLNWALGSSKLEPLFFCI